MSKDFRADCYFEAGRCLKLAKTQTIEQPEFWANLLGAAINAGLAGISDTALMSIWAEEERRAAKKEFLLKHLSDAVDKAAGKSG